MFLEYFSNDAAGSAIQDLEIKWGFPPLSGTYSLGPQTIVPNKFYEVLFKGK
jgi:hypothetical protein